MRTFHKVCDAVAISMDKVERANGTLFLFVFLFLIVVVAFMAWIMFLNSLNRQCNSTPSASSSTPSASK